MKRLLAFLTSLSMLSSSTLAVISCTSEVPWDYSPAFDEDGNNLTTRYWDIDQEFDIAFFKIFLLILSKEVFPNSSDFYQKMNDKTSDEIVENSFRRPDGTALIEPKVFNYNFTFLITNYASISAEVITKIQETNLINRESGIYLFLNLPNINIADIKNEPQIDFQFLFIIKHKDGTISNNKNNNWFYWDDWNSTNTQSEDNQYFFNLSNKEEEHITHVVTKLYQINYS